MKWSQKAKDIWIEERDAVLWELAQERARKEKRQGLGRFIIDQVDLHASFEDLVHYHSWYLPLGIEGELLDNDSCANGC